MGKEDDGNLIDKTKAKKLVDKYHDAQFIDKLYNHYKEARNNRIIYGMHYPLIRQLWKLPSMEYHSKVAFVKREDYSKNKHKRIIKSNIDIENRLLHFKENLIQFNKIIMITKYREKMKKYSKSLDSLTFTAILSEQFNEYST